MANKKEEVQVQVERQEIIESIKKCQSISIPRTINGYYVKTIYRKNIRERKVAIEVLAVFKDEKSNEILQYNVDVVNMFGTLFTSDAYTPDDIEYVADGVIKDIKIAKG